MTKFTYCDNVSGSFLEQFQRLNLDATREGEHWFQQGRKPNLLLILFRMKIRFFISFLVQGGFKKGYYGFMEAIDQALYQLFSYARWWELTEQERGKM